MLKEVFEKIGKQEQVEKIDVEEYLFEFSYNLMHVLSLLWSKNKRSYTPEFCKFVVRKCVKCMVRAFLSVEHNVEQIGQALDYYIKENLKVIEEFDSDYIILNMGIEFTGGANPTDIVLKMGALLAIMESKLGVSTLEILEDEFDF